MTGIVLAGMRFGLVGAANTVFGLAVIMMMLRTGMNDYAANFCGYALGLALSFVLNRAWTFGVRGKIAWREVIAFLLVVASSYAVNLVVLSFMRNLGYRESLPGKASAMLAYSMCFFILSRYFVFRRGMGEA